MHQKGFQGVRGNMKILLLTLGISKEYNDNFHAYRSIADKGHQICVISNKYNVLKAGKKEIFKKYELIDGISIFRIFKSMINQKYPFMSPLIINEINRLVLDFKPDLIFSENIDNLFLSLYLKWRFNLILVSRMEFLKNPENFASFSFGKSLIMKLPYSDSVINFLSSVTWSLLVRASSKIITHYIKDLEVIEDENKYKYIPWPTYLPVGLEWDYGFKQKKDRIIFIGAFDEHKQLHKLADLIPRILHLTKISEFVFVGGGVNGHIINDILKEYPCEVTHYESKSRYECLELIKESKFGISPAKWGSWGFIGDCWAMKTLLLYTDNHYEFNDMVDSVSIDMNDVVLLINELYNHTDKYDLIVKNGYSRYKKYHYYERVASDYLKVCNEALGLRK